MEFLSRLYSNIFNKTKPKSTPNSKYIFYKIVDFSPENQEYSIQCINTKAVFKQKICDIVLDVDILHGLHPVQSCYIGLETGSRIEMVSKEHGDIRASQQNFLISRYGRYEISCQLRNGDVCFIDKLANVEHMMDPRQVCLSDEIISEFDASHAFYMGIYAAKKKDSAESENYLTTWRKPELKLVK